MSSEVVKAVQEILAKKSTTLESIKAHAAELRGMIEMKSPPPHQAIIGLTELVEQLCDMIPVIANQAAERAIVRYTQSRRGM